ncbi:MAG: carbohydrate ABC transporter permease, partial [Leifsonia sp.]
MSTTLIPTDPDSAGVPVVARPRPGQTSVASPRKAISAVLANGVLIVIALCFLLPLGWLILASLDVKASY